MLAPCPLHLSTEVSQHEISDMGKQDLTRDWLLNSETWQSLKKHDKIPRNRGNDDIHSGELKHCMSTLNQSCFDLLVSSSIPSRIICDVVYQRKKRRKRSVTLSSTQQSGNIIQDEQCASLEEASCHEGDKGMQIPSFLEVNTNCYALGMNPSPSALSNKRRFDSEPNDAGKCLVPKCRRGDEFQSAIDSCSSSKSNMDSGSKLLKIGMDGASDCSSSCAFVKEADAGAEGISERDICVSILRNECLLESLWPVSTSEILVETGTSETQGFLEECKVCGISGFPQNLLICDNCEDAFHLSCSRVKSVPISEWWCNRCFKKKPKQRRDKTRKRSPDASIQVGRCRNASMVIAFMLKDTKPYATGVRIGKSFQVDIPEWSGPVASDSYHVGEALDVDATIPTPTPSVTNHDPSKPSKPHSSGKWLQCRKVIKGLSGDMDGTICGKWRRVPLSEAQTDSFECYNCLFWDPSRADCAVPQEWCGGEVSKLLQPTHGRH